MAYSFTPNEIATVFATKVPARLPFLANANNIVDREIRSGNGQTYPIVVPPYATATTGPEINEATQLQYASGRRNLTLTQYKVAFGADQAKRSLDIIDFGEQVAKPYAASLASRIQKDAIKDSQAQSNQCFVVNTTSNGAAVKSELDMQQLTDSSMAIREARSFGDIFGVLSPKVMGRASNIRNLFLPVDLSEKMWKDCVLGRFSDATWATTPDCGLLRTGTLADPVGNSSDTNYRIYTIGTSVSEGAESLTISVASAGTKSLAAGETINAGEVLNVTGCYGTDIYGNELYGTPRAFVVKSDHVVTAAEVTAAAFAVSVSPIYSTATPALVNASTLPASGAVVTKVTGAGKVYATGIVYDKDSIFVGQNKLLPMAGTESFGEGESAEGLIISYTAGNLVLKGAEIGRWDALIGWVTARPQWSSYILFEL